MQCSTCRASTLQFEGQQKGQCRRHAPKGADSDGNPLFPPVNADDWCWEYVDPHAHSPELGGSACGPVGTYVAIPE